MSCKPSAAPRIGRELAALAAQLPSTRRMLVAVGTGSTRRTIAPYRDLGILLDGGALHVHVGGSAGPPAHVGALLARVDSERLMYEYAAAFMQLHQEEAQHAEPTAAFVRRVGIDYLRERIVKDPRGRSLLFGRLCHLPACLCPIAKDPTNRRV